MAIGGKREGAGRPKGRLNKATADVKELALKYAPAAMTELARLSVQAENEPARVAAIKEILDRAYGKPKQSIDLDANVTLFDVASDPEPSEAEWSSQHAK